MRPSERYGLSGADVDELALLDDERTRRAADAGGRADAKSTVVDLRPGNRGAFALGCGLLILLALALVFGVKSGLDGEREPGAVVSPVDCGEERRMVDDLATRFVESEQRHRETEAILSSPFVPSPTPTQAPLWEYDGPYSAGVTPPEYQDRNDGDVRGGIGGRPR